MTTDEEIFQADQASIKALLDWANEHDVTHYVLLAAAGFLLGQDTADSDLKAELELAQQIVSEFAQSARSATNAAD